MTILPYPKSSGIFLLINMSMSKFRDLKDSLRRVVYNMMVTYLDWMSFLSITLINS